MRCIEFKSTRGEDELTVLDNEDGGITIETVNGDSEDVHVVYLDWLQVQELTNILRYWRGT
jgi:hypothetical protein